MALRLFTPREPAAPPSSRWWLSLFPHLSAAAKRRLLLLSLSAALLINGQLQIINRQRTAGPAQVTSSDFPFTLPAVQNALYQLNLPVRDPVGPQFQVNTYTSGYQFRPAVARDSDGDFVVVWTSEGSDGGDTSSYSIQGRRYNSAGTAQGNQFQVNTYTTNTQFRPSVAMDNDGDFVVVWQSFGSSGGDTYGYSIQGRRYDSAGVPQGSQFQVNTYPSGSQFYPAVALDSDGDFVVIWHSAGSSGSDTSSYSIQGRRYNSAGTALSSQFQVNTYTTNDQIHPAISLDSDGDFAVVWQSAGSSGGDTSSFSIQGQRYNAAGAALGSQFQVNSYTTNAQEYPAISLDATGDFVTVWHSSGNSGGDTDGRSIQGQRYNSTGTPQGSQFQVNSYTFGHQRNPAVALDSDGDFVVVWYSAFSSGSDFDGYSIQGQGYNSAGVPQGAEFQVNTYTTDDQRRPDVSLDSDGDFVVVWQSAGSSGNDNDAESIQGQRFSSLEPTPTPTPTPSATPTTTPSPTATSPAGPPTGVVYLPAIIAEEFAYFAGPCEAEPNNSAPEANGYLRSGQSYCGYPDDARDYFKVYLPNAGTITADLTGHTGEGVQLQLFYQSTSNLVDFATGQGPLHVEHNGPAGLYYIFTLSGFNTTTPYALVATYP